jgi:TrfB plasmid transcriptional repressor
MKMTEAQFDFIARLMRSKDPARQGAKLVLLHGVPNAEAARALKTTPQTVQRAAKRIAEEHQEATRLFLK